MTSLTPNQIWQDDQGQQYQIIHIIQDDQGHDWVHYRTLSMEPQEHSCWVETFLQRYQEVLQ
jgi:hypothetical protein